MEKLMKLTANGLTKQQGDAILSVATEIGDKLGDAINAAIDEVFDRIEKAINKNA